MRMWNVPPEVMCRQHLLGEHSELHMFIGTLRRKKSIEGFVRGNLVDTRLLWIRHMQLAAEMKARGYKHQSPLPRLRVEGQGQTYMLLNLQELARRCPECRELQREAA